MRSREPLLLQQATRRDRMRISQRRETAGQPVKPGCPASTIRSDEVIASSGVTFHICRLYQHASLACLFFPLFSQVREPGEPGPLVLGFVPLEWHPESDTREIYA